MTKLEEGEDEVKSACPLCPGLQVYYNGYDNEMRRRETLANLKNVFPVRIVDCNSST